MWICTIWIFLLGLTKARAQLDSEELKKIFGTPPPNRLVSTTGLEDITVRSTTGIVTGISADGETCQCVPYYLCNNDHIGVDANNASVTGWGTLNVRFNDECQESVEICCKIPDVSTSGPPTVLEPTRPQGCGYNNPKGLDFKIVGGTGAETLFGEYPWVVALLDSQNMSYVGVGVLIHPQVVLTAAHKVYKRQAANTLKIRAGEWDTQTVKERLPHQERMVKDIVVHQEFHDATLRFDAALLLLEEPVQLAPHINVVCLPRQGEFFETNQQCVSNGWGKDVFGARGKYAVIQKKVVVDMVPHDRCNALLKETRLGHRFVLHESFICAGGKESEDTCQGDGGAPLACPYDVTNNRYILTGLVAWGISCGQKDVPGVYVNVACFRDWVDFKMNEWSLDSNAYSV